MDPKKASSYAKARAVVTARCMLADRTRMDCELLASSLQRASSHCKILGSAANLDQARQILGRYLPDVAVVSPHLAEGPLAGFDLVQEMREAFPQTRAVMLLDTMEPRMVIYSFQVGAKGVFSRDRSVEALAKCIDVIHKGQIWAGTNELHIILQAMAKRSHFEPLTATGVKLLTSREAQVAALVADGLRNKEISERMKLSAHTVKNYLYRVYEKLGISSRVELTARVLEEARGSENQASGDPARLAG